MRWKEFFRPTVDKIIITFILTAIGEYFAYQYGERGFSVRGPIGSSGALNYGMLFLIVYLLPTLFIFYFVCSIAALIKKEGLNKYLKEIGLRKWLYILVLFPYLYFKEHGGHFDFGYFPREIFFLGRQGSNWGINYFNTYFYQENLYFTFLFSLSILIAVFLICSYKKR